MKTLLLMNKILFKMKIKCLKAKIKKMILFQKRRYNRKNKKVKKVRNWALFQVIVAMIRANKKKRNK